MQNKDGNLICKNCEEEITTEEHIEFEGQCEYCFLAEQEED